MYVQRTRKEYLQRIEIAKQLRLAAKMQASAQKLKPITEEEEEEDDEVDQIAVRRKQRAR